MTIDGTRIGLAASRAAYQAPVSRRVAEGPPVVARCDAASRSELLSEHGGAAVADPFGDLLDRQARGFE